MVENLLIYLGENHPTLESYKVFRIVNKKGGDSRSDLYEVQACDVNVKLTFIEWLKSLFVSNEHHPALKLRSVLVSKDKTFATRGTNPLIMFVFPDTYNELMSGFKSDSTLANCFKTYYDLSADNSRADLTVDNAERKESENLSIATQSATKDEELFREKVKSLKALNESMKPTSVVQPINPQLQYMGGNQ